MSDDSNLITMEDDGGVLALPPEITGQPDDDDGDDQSAATPVTEPPAAAPPARPEPDPAMRGVLAELSRTREELRAERQQRESLSEQAEAARVIRAALQARPDIAEALRGRPLSSGTAAPDPSMLALAESLSLYTVDGKPDVAAAARVASFTREEAERVARSVANEAVKPLRERAVNDAASQMRREAIDAGQQFGMPPEFVQPIIDNLIGQNPELAADANNMSTALLVAKGLYAIQQEQAAARIPAPSSRPAPSAPAFSERGNARGGSPVMSALEQKIARQIGASPESWMESVNRLSGISDGAKHITFGED